MRRESWKTAGMVLAAVFLAAGGYFGFRSWHGKATAISTDSVKPSIREADAKPVISEQEPETTDDSAGGEESLADSADFSSAASVSSSSAEGGSRTSDNASTSSVSKSFKIIDRLVGFGFEKSSGRKIDTLIVHSSYDAIGSEPYRVSGLIAEYKSYGVSPHYLIDREGNVYRLVADRNIAYHAGESKVPDGRTNVNDFSLGVEIMTTKTDKPTSAQYAALNGLIAYLKGKYEFKYVLGHDDIAPGRKDDPWNFDWSKVKK